MPGPLGVCWLVGEQPQVRLLGGTVVWLPVRSLIWKAFIARDSVDGVSHRVPIFVCCVAASVGEVKLERHGENPAGITSSTTN